MALLTGTRIIQPIVPNDSNDTYPTHLDSYGKGGYKSVSDLTERNSIPVNRQKLGMAVYVISDGNVYILDSCSGDLTNDNWSLLQISGSSGIIVSDTTPSSPTEGMLWLNSTTDYLSIYTNGSWEFFVYKSTMESDVGNLILNGGYF